MGRSEAGLYDMAGNVAEWVNDRFSDAYYAESPAANPPGEAYKPERVFRGGNAGNEPEDGFDAFRTTARSRGSGALAGLGVGFRCVRPDDEIAVCGNGVLEPSELCDDGNLDDADGCSAECEKSGALAEIFYVRSPGALYQPGGEEPYAGVFDLLVDGERVVMAGTSEPEGQDGSYLTAIELLPGTKDVPPPLTFISETAVGGSSFDRLNGLALGPDGQYYAVGLAAVDGASDILVRRYSSDPQDYFDDEVTWELLYDGGIDGPDEGYDIAADDDGTLLVAGRVRTQDNSYDAWVARIDPSKDADDPQAIADEATYDDSTTHGSDRANAIALDPDGNVIAAGMTTTEKNQQIWVSKFDADLQPLWTTIYESPASEMGEETEDEVAHDVVVAENGSIYVTGQVWEGVQGMEPNPKIITDIVVLRLDPDGTVEWAESFDLPNSGDQRSTDVGYAIDRYSDGSLLIGGSYQSGPGGLVMMRVADGGTEPMWITTLIDFSLGGVGVFAVSSTDDGGILFAGRHDNQAFLAHAIP
jgi:cysteine-rich repeat protein